MSFAQFRTVKSPDAARVSLAKHRAFFRTDELCCFQKKAGHGMRKPCGARAMVEISGKWYCTPHSRKVQGT